jgi:hypothetical protein
MLQHPSLTQPLVIPKDQHTSDLRQYRSLRSAERVLHGTEPASSLDAAVIFASVAKLAALDPAIVLWPRGAFAAWREPGSEATWHYVDFPRPGDSITDFHGACAAADNLARRLLSSHSGPGEYPNIVVSSIREARELGIRPLNEA